MGPVAKPSTYRVVASVVTSNPTRNSLLALGMAGAKMALVNDTMNVPLQTRMEVNSLVGKMGHQYFSPSRLSIEFYILGGTLPVVGMLGIIPSIEFDCVTLGVGKGWWDGSTHTHGQFLAHRLSASPCLWSNRVV